MHLHSLFMQIQLKYGQQQLQLLPDVLHRNDTDIVTHYKTDQSTRMTLPEHAEERCDLFPSIQSFWVATRANQQLSLWSLWWKQRSKLRMEKWPQEIFVFVRGWIRHWRCKRLVICGTSTHQCSPAVMTHPA